MLRTDQKLTDKQGVPGEFGEDPRLDAVFGIGAAVEVLREQRLALGVRAEILEQIIEMLPALLAVTVPPHCVFGRRIDYCMLVLGRSAGVMAGFGAQRAAVDDGSLAVADSVFVQRRRGQIPVYAGEILEAELIRPVGGISETRFLHASLR